MQEKLTGDVEGGGVRGRPTPRPLCGPQEQQQGGTGTGGLWNRRAHTGPTQAPPTTEVTVQRKRVLSVAPSAGWTWATEHPQGATCCQKKLSNFEDLRGENTFPYLNF